MFKSRYAKFMFAPDTGADGGNGGDGVVEATPDYKALYEQSQALFEKEKQEKLKFKEAFDKKASELSAKEKAERAKMSEEEQRAAELAEKEQRLVEMQNRVYEMETTTLFAEQGFDKKDYGELVKQVVEIGGEKSGELSSAIIEFVKKANKAAVANAKNAAIKDGAVPPKTSTTTVSGDKSDYQLYQESKTKTNNIVQL